MTIGPMRPPLWAAAYAALVAGAFGAPALASPAPPASAPSDTAEWAEPGAQAERDADGLWPPIVITAADEPRRVKPPQIRLGADLLLDLQPRTLADALRGVAGVSTRPNSRGETTIRVRGAEERQSQVFLDGAPLAVPWDGRVDLGLIPAGLIGGIAITKGAVPIEYGANAVSGVVDLRTRGPGDAGITGIAQAGTMGFRQAAIVTGLERDGLEVVAAASLMSRDAERVADPAAVPFSQAASRRRTNSDFDGQSLFAAIGHDRGSTRLRASVLHIDAERGIAPESDRDPARAAPRYWRYPLFRMTQATLSGQFAPADGAELRMTAWRQWFDQRIDAFRNVSYTALRSRQRDEDVTSGVRATLAHDAGPLALRWSGQVQHSRHEQVDTPFPAAVPGPRLAYAQRLLSLGVEADAPLADALRATFGLAYDRATTPLTGDKPRQPVADAPAFSAALAWTPGPGWSVTVSGGRRTRFASPRELFGEALGRFLINPDLRPERAWLGDLELNWQGDGVSLTLNPFIIRGTGTLSQRVVTVNGTALRQRFNLSGTLSTGMDATLTARPAKRLSVQLAASLLRARADAEDALPFRRLVQRPGTEIALALDYLFPGDADLRAELRHIGGAVDLDAAGARIALPAATELNMQAAVPLVRLGAARLSLTLAADNLTDALILPQTGLPLAGRTLRLGIRID